MITLHEYTRLPADFSAEKARAEKSRRRRLIISLVSIGVRVICALIIGADGLRHILLSIPSDPHVFWPLLFGLCFTGSIAWNDEFRTTAPTPQQEVQVRLRIDQIASVLAVLDLEDYGPGYVITLASGEVLFISGEPLSDLDEQGESLPENLEITITLPSGDLQQLAGSGNRQPVRGDISYNRLEVDCVPGFAILKPSLNLTPEIDFLTGDRQGGHDLASS